MRLPDPSRIELLELDIDTRIAVLWQQLDILEAPLTIEIVSQFMRAAYAFGYCDALKAPDPEAWLRGHGYYLPRREP